MNRVLTFGFLPQEVGGKQKNGLAYGIYNLTKSFAAVDKDSSYFLAAIDIKKKIVYSENITVIGWTFYILLKYCLLEFYAIPKFLLSAIKIRKIAPYYKLHIILFKLIFFSYAIKKINPDLIHFHGCDDALISIYLPNHKCNRTLRLHGINGFDSNVKNYLQYRKVERYITNWCNFDLVTFISTDNMTTWKNKYGNFNCSQEVILNGYDERVFYPSKRFDRKKNRKIKLLTIGKISKLKGQDRVILAISMTGESEKFNYTIIGKCYNLKDSIHQLVNEHNLQVDLIEFIPQNELRKYFSDADYFILPSSSEGFGMVFIESIACGTPVIIPKHLPLVKEMGILDEKNSVFLEDESFESIYNCLKTGLNKNYDRDEVAMTVKNLTWNNIAKNYLKEIMKLYN